MHGYSGLWNGSLRNNMEMRDGERDQEGKKWEEGPALWGEAVGIWGTDVPTSFWNTRCG